MLFQHSSLRSFGFLQAKRNPHSLQNLTGDAMNNAQFLRIEEYSQKTVQRKNGETRGNVFGILKEAEREASHSKHVNNPMKPEIIFGITASEMLSELNYLSENVKVNNKKIRKDARILTAGIASYPIKQTSKEFDIKHFEIWKKVTVEYLKAKFNSNIKSVICHMDESNPHLHFYLYNSKDLNMRSFHPAFLAEDNEKNTKLKRKAFRSGLTEFQDQYFKLTSKPLGFERKTVQRERRSRKTQLAMNDMNKLSSDKDFEILKLKRANLKLINVINSYKNNIKLLKLRLSKALGFGNSSYTLK